MWSLDINENTPSYFEKVRIIHLHIITEKQRLEVMKRYRDYKLYCNDVQYPTELLDMIEQASIEKSYKTTR